MKMEAICWILPCPKGCLSSGFWEDSFTLPITTTELAESERVCQASAVRAMDPDITPAQNLSINKAMFANMEIPPSSKLARFLSMPHSVFPGGTCAFSRFFMAGSTFVMETLFSPRVKDASSTGSFMPLISFSASGTLYFELWSLLLGNSRGNHTSYEISGFLSAFHLFQFEEPNRKSGQASRVGSLLR